MIFAHSGTPSNPDKAWAKGKGILIDLFDVEFSCLNFCGVGQLGRNGLHDLDALVEVRHSQVPVFHFFELALNVGHSLRQCFIRFENVVEIHNVPPKIKF